MSTPIATVADALFAFIMSLLRDPDAVEEFNANPQAALNNHGLGDACAADVRAVKPVVVDHPSVVARAGNPQQQYPPGTQFDSDPDPQDEVIQQINRIVNQFTSIDARTTIVDQSTNQNIWTGGGDVTQIFDQDAVVASGDESVAAGDDATTVDSDVDITVGDVLVGNTTNDGSYNTDNSDDIEINDSFNGDNSTSSTIDGSFNSSDDADLDDASLLTTAEEPSADEASAAATAAGAAVATAVDAATGAAVSASSVAPAEEPAELLSADLTDTDMTYESDAASVVLEEPMLEDLAEEQ